MYSKVKLMMLIMKRKKNLNHKNQSKVKVLEFESSMRKDFSTKRSSLKLKIEKLGPFFKMMNLDLCSCDNGHFMIALHIQVTYALNLDFGLKKVRQCLKCCSLELEFLKKNLNNSILISVARLRTHFLKSYLKSSETCINFQTLHSPPTFAKLTTRHRWMQLM